MLGLGSVREPCVGEAVRSLRLVTVICTLNMFRFLCGGNKSPYLLIRGSGIFNYVCRGLGYSKVGFFTSVELIGVSRAGAAAARAVPRHKENQGEESTTKLSSCL